MLLGSVGHRKLHRGVRGGAAAFQMIPLAAEPSIVPVPTDGMRACGASVVPHVPVRSNRTRQTNPPPGERLSAADLPEPSRRFRLLFPLIKKNNGVPCREPGGSVQEE